MRFLASIASNAFWRDQISARTERFAFLLVVVFVTGLGTLTATQVLFNSTLEPLASEIVFIEDKSRDYSVTDAESVLLSDGKSDTAFRNNLSENPFWGLIQLRIDDPTTPRVLEFPDGQTIALDTWILDSSGAIVGQASATRSETGSGLEQIGRGFALTLPDLAPGTHRVLFRTQSKGQSIISARLWEARQFVSYIRGYERAGGFLAGSFVILAAFSLLVSVRVRERVFLAFAGWLLANLAIAATFDGYLGTWFAEYLTPEAMVSARELIFVSFGIATVALLRSLFGNEFRQAGLSRISALLYAPLLIALALLFIVPPATWFPIMWVCGGISAIGAAALLTWAVSRSGASSAKWLGLGWVALLAGICGELVWASGLVLTRLPWLNFDGGAVLGALSTGVAVAEVLRTERLNRQLAQRKTEKVLREYQHMYDSVPIGLFSLNDAGQITHHNREFEQLQISKTPGATTPIPLENLFGMDESERLTRALQTTGQIEAEVLTVDEGQTERWFQIKATRAGRVSRASIQDITRRKDAENRLRRLADHDPLTDLLNRRGLDSILKDQLGGLEQGTIFSVAYLDLDRFKLINDLFGHQAGDHVLRQVALRLTATLEHTPGAWISRIGGDEFVVVFSNRTLTEAGALAERLLSEITSQPYQFKEKAFSVSGSIGVIAVTSAMSDRDVIAGADRACATAKAKGRGTVVTLASDDPALVQHFEEMSLVAGIRDRLPDERFVTVFQPIFPIHDANRELNFEVLLRVLDPSGRATSPARVLAAAERNGAMATIDRWVLSNTLEWLSDNPEMARRPGFVTVNLSGASLNDERFIRDALALLSEHSRGAHRVCFEITESIALHDLANTRSFVERVRSYGARIALDDFGAGYTSFTYLKSIPAEFVKVDGSFIKDLDRDRSNLAICSTIATLVKELGMLSVAEWVETPETLSQLKSIGFDYAQGFGLCAPRSRHDLDGVESASDLLTDARVREIVGVKDCRPRRDEPLISLATAEQ